MSQQYNCFSSILELRCETTYLPTYLHECICYKTNQWIQLLGNNAFESRNQGTATDLNFGIQPFIFMFLHSPKKALIRTTKHLRMGRAAFAVI